MSLRNASTGILSRMVEELVLALPSRNVVTRTTTSLAHHCRVSRLANIINAVHRPWSQHCPRDLRSYATVHSQASNPLARISGSENAIEDVPFANALCSCGQQSQRRSTEHAFVSHKYILSLFNAESASILSRFAISIDDALALYIPCRSGLHGGIKNLS